MFGIIYFSHCIIILVNKFTSINQSINHFCHHCHHFVMITRDNIMITMLTRLVHFNIHSSSEFDHLKIMLCTCACVYVVCVWHTFADMRTSVPAYMRTSVHAYKRACVHAYMRKSMHA